MINNVFFIIFWLVVFDLNGGNIKDITMTEILFIWGLPAGAWGMSNFLFNGLNYINTYIITGTLDTYLLQPKNIIMSIALSKMDFGAFGDLMYGLVICAIACSSITQFLLSILFMIIGGLIMCSCFIIVRTFAIWLGDVEQIATIFSQSILLTFSTYPYEIFGKVARILMYTVVPAYYIVHLPIKIINIFSLKSFAVVTIVAAIWCLIAIVFFYQAIKKYESGNNIAMKQ
jgi:ABC-2 type transport system permease protein